MFKVLYKNPGGHKATASENITVHLILILILFLIVILKLYPLYLKHTNTLFVQSTILTLFEYMKA